MEHKRLWLSPVSASDPHAECACRLILPHAPPPPHPPLKWGVPLQGRASLFVHTICTELAEVDDRLLLGVFHSVESRQMQWESGLRRPDVTGLSKTLWPSSHPAHTLQAEVHWPQGSRSRHKGVVFMCVSVCPWAFTWASVCLCVCRWKQGLGNWEWESPDCNSGCYLGNPGRKMCWMSEWERDVQ